MLELIKHKLSSFYYLFFGTMQKCGNNTNLNFFAEYWLDDTTVLNTYTIYLHISKTVAFIMFRYYVPQSIFFSKGMMIKSLTLVYLVKTITIFFF